MSDRGEAIEITDSRPCAVDPSYTLAGLSAAVYRHCEEAKPLESLHLCAGAWNGFDCSPEHLTRVFEELRARKLILELNGRILGLAVREQVSPMPELWEFPFGYANPPVPEEAMITKQTDTLCIN